MYWCSTLFTLQLWQCTYWMSCFKQKFSAWNDPSLPDLAIHPSHWPFRRFLIGCYSYSVRRIWTIFCFSIFKNPGNSQSKNNDYFSLINSFAGMRIGCYGRLYLSNQLTFLIAMGQIFSDFLSDSLGNVWWDFKRNGRESSDNLSENWRILHWLTHA